MKIISIIGARPQFIKLAAFSEAVKRSEKKIEHKILHTGQHYDANMSDTFFDELGIDSPCWNLHITASQQGEMTGRMLQEIESILLAEQPDFVVVFGDTNSTLAGALAAVKIHIPLVHIEAGLRSFNKQMPEEINRILADHCSDVLFCPTSQAVKHLAEENITKNVYNVGDIMFDVALHFGEIATKKSQILKQLRLKEKEFVLLTVHRAENTIHEKLLKIFTAVNQIAQTQKVVFPVHPRTAKIVSENSDLQQLISHENILQISSVGYLDMVMLEKSAQVILTDSGGVQKEAYFQKTPCVTLRNETEWTETVDSGWNQIAGVETNQILECWRNARPSNALIAEYGDGHCAEKIIDILCQKEF